MSVVGWFPRFSPDGMRLTWERPGYWRAQWLDDHTEIGDNGVNLVIGGVPTTIPTCNDLGAGGGRWAACRTDPVRIYTSWGLVLPGAGCPSLGPDGRFAYVDARQSAVKNLIFDGQLVARGAITSIRSSRAALVWMDAGITWGLRLEPGAVARQIQVSPWEAGPVPIDTPTGPWVLNYTQTGIILRPFGDSLGYRFENGGQTYFPDAVWQGDHIQVVFSDDRGNETQLSFPLTAPRIPLGALSPIEKVPGPIVNQPPVQKSESPVSITDFSALLASIWDADPAGQRALNAAMDACEARRAVAGEDDALTQQLEQQANDIKGGWASRFATAIARHDPRVGQRKKASGQHYVRADGVAVSTDALMLSDSGQIIDVMSDRHWSWNLTPGDTQPVDQWVAAIPARAPVVTPPPPVAVPPPVVIPPPVAAPPAPPAPPVVVIDAALLADILGRLTALEARCAALEIPKLTSPRTVKTSMVFGHSHTVTIP